MYTYSIFSVEPKIAAQYFYKSGILYRFLQEFKRNRDHNHLQLQYKYAIASLNLSMIEEYIGKLNVEIDKRDVVMKVHWEGKSLTIFEDDRHLEIRSETIADLEEFLFPVLRDSPHYYFVIRNQMKDYGWLSLQKNTRLSKQLLYSIP